jgi:hypothetical protein
VTYTPPAPVRTTVVRRTPKPATPEKPKVEPLPARIVAIVVVDGGTQITVARGTANGASNGMAGALKNFGFTLKDCSETRCKAVLSATPDQVRGAGDTVFLKP